ncbi:MAG TPA: putative sulfate exporter family transporter [Candidatus Polarisedimenticolaceae bacterium]
MSDEAPGSGPRLGDVLPGLGVVAAVAVAARLLHAALPESVGRVLGEVFFAVLAGLALGNAFRLPAATVPGIRFAFETVLRLAIVLLGAGLSFVAALAIGVKALALIVLLMVLALATTHLLGRRLGVPAKLASLIGVGTAVCGNSAISATAPAIGARDEDVAYAIATNTLFGTLAVFAYPLIGHALGLGDSAFGTWAGTAVNDTSQVVAAGFAYSDAAGQVATVVKLTRNALMGVVIVVMGFLHGRASRGEGLGTRLRQSVPWFVVGFLVVATLNTLGLFTWLTGALGTDVPQAIRWTARSLILLALAGVGLGTRIDAMRRTGLLPLWVGLAAAVVTSVASYAWIRFVGPVG